MRRDLGCVGTCLCCGDRWVAPDQFRGGFVFCVGLVPLTVNPLGSNHCSAPRSVTSLSSKSLLEQELLQCLCRCHCWEQLRSVKHYGNGTAPPWSLGNSGHPTFLPSSGIKAFGFGSRLHRTSSARPVWAVKSGASYRGPERTELGRFCSAVSSPLSCCLPRQGEGPRGKDQGGF